MRVRPGKFLNGLDKPMGLAGMDLKKENFKKDVGKTMFKIWFRNHRFVFNFVVLLQLNTLFVFKFDIFHFVSRS